MTDTSHALPEAEPRQCPVHPVGQRKLVPPGERDDPALEWVDRGRERVLVIRSHDLARQLLRIGDGTRQAGFLGDLILDGTPAIRNPILYLEGPEHREHRSATARFFAPKVVERDYQAMIDAQVEDAVERVRTGPATRLDMLSLQLSVAVAARVVGLTESNHAGWASGWSPSSSSGWTTRPSARDRPG